MSEYDATIRRLQERVVQEEQIRQLGRKPPGESEETKDNDPASDEQQQQTIYTTAHTTTTTSAMGSDFERHVQQQAAILERFERTRDALADQFQQQANITADSPVSSLGEEIWTCVCGLDCSMEHRFCGNCGGPRPENWFCECGNENSDFHRFCTRCGREGLFYEDDDDEEEHLRDIPSTIPPPAQGWDEVDDELTFANDSCADEPSRAATKQQQHPAQQKAGDDEDDGGAWTCGACTYLNENPLFMCCELCGSARPASPDADVETMAKKVAQSGDDSTADSSKKKEKHFSEMIRDQQKRSYQQQQQGNQPKSFPEPETDHELAMIYAQQERILAQFQQQQQQQQHR